MTQLSARVYIKVTEPSVWQNLMAVEIKPEYGIMASPDKFFGKPLINNSTELIADDGWLIDCDSLIRFVSTIKKTAGDKCVVIADTTLPDTARYT